MHRSEAFCFLEGERCPVPAGIDTVVNRAGGGAELATRYQLRPSTFCTSIPAIASSGNIRTFTPIRSTPRPGRGVQWVVAPQVVQWP